MTDKENKIPKCSLCDKPRSEKYRPFCSKHCADLDLNRWLTGQYAIPVEEEEPDDFDRAISQANSLSNPENDPTKLN